MKIIRLLLLSSLVVLTGCASLGIGSRPLSDLTRDYSNEASRFMSVDDLVIHYRDEGKGQALVLLHGEGSSLHSWDGWVKALKHRYRIIRLDLPAHGLTGADPKVERYKTSYMIGKLDKFLTRLGVSKAVVAGHSLGGYLAWNYALYRPGRVSKLIMIGAVGYPQDKTFMLSGMAWPLVRDMSTLMMPRCFVSSSLRRSYFDVDKVSDKQVRRYHDLLMRQGNRRGLINVLRTMREQADNSALGDRIKQLRIPVLLMWGEQDERVPLTVLEKFRQDLSGARVVTYEGVGHIPMEELPVQSARDAADFIRNGGLSRTLGQSAVNSPVPVMKVETDTDAENKDKSVNTPISDEAPRVISE